jgi:hypothetical protein
MGEMGFAEFACDMNGSTSLFVSSSRSDESMKCDLPRVDSFWSGVKRGMGGEDADSFRGETEQRSLERIGHGE